MSTQRSAHSSTSWTFIMMLAILLMLSSIAYAGNTNHAKKMRRHKCKNALYLIDNTRNGDGMSIIYRVKPNRQRGKAFLKEVTRLPYDRAHIAMGPRCRRLYAVQNGDVRLGYVNMVTKSFTDLGPLDIQGVVQAGFNREGQLYIASGRTNKVYIVDMDLSVTPPLLDLQEMGGVEAPDSTGVNIGGADLVFTPDGAMYVMTRKGGNIIYEIADESAGLTANRAFNGVGRQATGLAFLPRNPRYLERVAEFNRRSFCPRPFSSFVFFPLFRFRFRPISRLPTWSIPPNPA